MKSKTSIRLLALPAIVATMIGALSTTPASADLLRLQDGKFHAGRILEEDDARIQFKTGTRSGPLELSLEKSEIAQIYRMLDEAQQIDQVMDANRLQNWAAAYFHAELESPAIQCVRRAWKLNPDIGKKPLGEGSAGFQTFWNRMIFRELDSGLPIRDAATMLNLARWAREAGLDLETAHAIRNAWCHDRSSKQIRELAESWQVNLESWAEVDLTSGLTVSLFTSNLRDDGNLVTAGAGKHFLSIPILYDRDAGPRVLSKSVLSGKERRAFYGFRIISGPPERQPVDSLQGGTVYERVELKQDGDPARRLILKNNLSPRISQEEGPSRERLKARAEGVRASGWALLIVETSMRARNITLSWGDGGFETIDLAYLRNVGRPLLDASRRTPESPEIKASLDRLGHNSGATAALALTQLAAVQSLLPAEKREAWAARVDTAIVSTASRLEWQVRHAVWEYFTGQETVSPAALRALRTKNASIKSGWINMIQSHVEDSDTHSRKIAMQLLCAILHSKDKSICQSAMDTLLILGIEIDWNLVSTASETARLAALDRIERLPREEAARMLIALMGSVTRSSADPLARSARSLNLILSDPRDPILTQWSSLKRREDRRALLTVLSSIDLGDLIYSRSFDAIMRDATSPDEHARLRAEAFTTIIEQSRRRASSSSLREVGSPRGAAFPVLVQMDVTDPVLRTLTEATESGPPSLQRDALAALLLEGYAEQAEKALLAGRREAGELDDLLQSLMAREDVAECNGLLALLGRLLSREHIGSAGRIFSHLSDIVARNPASERWRILAAVKSGVNIKELNELVVSLRPSRAVTASRWLHRLGHLTPQDRQRLAASHDPEVRLEQLKRIDQRRAKIVDGRYGVIAVIEICVAQPIDSPPDEDNLGMHSVRWHVPRRTTMILPTLTIRSDDADNTYRVLWGDRLVGLGVPRARNLSIRGPGAFSFRLVNPGPELLGEHGWGWPVSQRFGPPDDPRDFAALGPAILPGNRPVLKKPTADFMTLKLTDYLRAAVVASGLIKQEEAVNFVPDGYAMTLRYAAFASYTGVGKTRPPPQKEPTAGHRHLLNMMLLLERID
ncbi:MAG: hypothetical protein ACE5EQ_06285 [Phycisphaerae bacterium]